MAEFYETWPELTSYRDVIDSEIARRTAAAEQKARTWHGVAKTNGAEVRRLRQAKENRDG